MTIQSIIQHALPVFVPFFYDKDKACNACLRMRFNISYPEVTRLFTRLNAARLLNFQLFDVRFMLGLRLFDSGSHS